MKTLKDLLLAMINATLILVALCLFLLWQVSGAAERVVATFAQNLDIIQPLNDQVTEMRAEVASLRSDLRALPTNTTDQANLAKQRLLTRADALQTGLVDINESLQTIAETPDRLMSQGMDRLASKASAGATSVLSCLKPDPASTTDSDT